MKKLILASSLIACLVSGANASQESPDKKLTTFVNTMNNYSADEELSSAINNYRVFCPVADVLILRDEYLMDRDIVLSAKALANVSLETKLNLIERIINQRRQLEQELKRYREQVKVAQQIFASIPNTLPAEAGKSEDYNRISKMLDEIQQ